MAMGQWVDNPHAETALSNILPCVDQATTNATLYKSKLVVNDIAYIMNGFIGTYANANAPQGGNSNYYNQSGPLMPYLCCPYDSQLRELQCPPQLVSMENASEVWENYTCTVSESGSCTSTGRLTPDMYQQLVGAVNISYALQHYAPPLLSLQDCNFVRETFKNITSDYCPPLENCLRMVNAGLGLVSVGVMLSLALWIIYANRPQREETSAKISSRFKGRGDDSRWSEAPILNFELASKLECILLMFNLEMEIIPDQATRVIETPVSSSMGTMWCLSDPTPSSWTAKLRNDILMFQQHQCESLSEAWTRFKDLLQKSPHHGIDMWLQVQIFYDHVNPATRRTIGQSAGGKLRDKNTKESWALIEDISRYDNESWNNPRDFSKPIKAISLPQDVPSTSNRRLIELENQV
nr:ion transport domain-containing protein [Tanacetum cinerariifolium]